MAITKNYRTEREYGRNRYINISVKEKRRKEIMKEIVIEIFLMIKNKN